MKIKNLLMIILLAQFTCALHINEVMYNPEGIDNNKEFIEIFLDSNQSLENWTIADSDSNDTLSILYLVDSSYALIVEEGYEYENSGASYYSVGTTIGNNLNNDMDEIYLYDLNNMLVDSMAYGGELANNNGMTIEYYNGTWYESMFFGGTPGQENSVIEFFNKIPDNNTNTSVNNTSTNKTYTTNSTDEDQSDNLTDSTAPQDDNETNNQTTEPETCNINISIYSSRLIFEDGEKVSYKIDLNDKSYPYIIEYWVEDLQENIVKSKYNTTNTNQRTWTPACEDGDVFLIKARVADLGCVDTNPDDDHAEMPVVIRCPASAVEQEDTFTENIEIEEIYLGSDESAEFGEIIRVKLYISKGDTAKTAVEMYAEGADGKVSETTSMNLNSKDSEITVTVPLAIKPNCDEKFEDGDFTLVVSGLGTGDTAEFEIKGKKSGICKYKEKTVYKEKECNCQPCKCGPDKEEPEIKSFYTLAKKYSDKIRLFANIECLDNCTLLLSDEKGIIDMKKLSNHSGKVDFNVSADKHFYLELQSLLSYRNLSVDLEFPEIEAMEKEEAVQTSKEADKFADTVTTSATTEPETVYEGSGEKTKNRIKYFLMGVLGLLAVIVVFKKGF